MYRPAQASRAHGGKYRLKIGEVCVGREQRRRIGDGRRGDCYRIAVSIPVIEANLKGRAIRHTAAISQDTDR